MLQYATMTKTASSQKGDSLGNDPLMGLQDSQFSAAGIHADVNDSKLGICHLPMDLVRHSETGIPIETMYPNQQISSVAVWF